MKSWKPRGGSTVKRVFRQALVEYAVMMALCVILAASALALLNQFSSYGGWLLKIIGVGYP